jgi:ribonuclease HII
MLLTCFNDTDSSTVIEIGIDEAGRGSFWGPIMAGAFIVPPQTEWTEKQKELFSQLRDSKKITPKKRERIFDLINECITHKGVGLVTSNEINENGISWANQEAFRRAIKAIPFDLNLKECRLIIDGVLPISDWDGTQELIIEGDGKYLAISGASILAKVSHDRWITEYCTKNTECAERYDLEKSKGYGTAKHRDSIRVYGGHELHRTLYIQNWLPGVEPVIKKKRTKKSSSNESNLNEEGGIERGECEEKCLIKF